VRVLATSREVLGVPDEQIVPVRPLAVPDSSGTGDPTELGEYPSVRLFIERARQVDPRFSLNRANAAAIATICHRFDGLPLALELAAARLQTEELSTLAAKVERDPSSPVLSSTSSGHRGLAEAMASSYSRLLPASALLFRRLSAFAGDFDRAQALAMAPAGSTAWPAALDDLVARSLVLRREGGGYHVLTPAREFASGQMTEAERAEIEALHADIMVLDATTNGRRIRGREEREAVLALRAHFDDYRSAWLYLFEHGRLGDAATLITSIFQFALLQPRPEVYGWAAALGAALDAEEPLAADVLGAAALGRWYSGDMATAVSTAERATTIGTGTAGHLVWARTALVDALAYAGRLDELRVHYAALVQELYSTADPYWIVNGLGFECISFVMSRRPDKAQQRVDQAFALARELENPDCLQWALYAQGRVLERSDPGAASKMYEAGMRVAREVDSRFNLSLHLAEWVALERSRHDARRAAEGALDLLDLVAVSGNRAQLSRALREAALCLEAAGRRRAAARVFLARQGLPEMPRDLEHDASDVATVEALSRALADEWVSIEIDARITPEREVVALCRDELVEMIASMPPRT
jgi:predicted ATPase